LVSGIPALTLSGIGLVIAAYVLLFLSSILYLIREKPLDFKLRGVNYVPVTIEIATYNEGLLVRRSILSIRELIYPKELLRVLILDDSDDRLSLGAVDAAAQELRTSGIAAEVIRRQTREGGKPGFLKQVENLVSTPYVFIVDADFRLEPDSLEKAISYASCNDFSFYQLRWSLEGNGLISNIQRFLLQFHLSEEQEKVFSLGLPVKINGSCSLIKTKDLISIGGWNPSTITEDLDLAIRFYLAGKKGAYLPYLGGTGLTTPSFGSLFKQLDRWVVGDAQALKAYGLKIIKSTNLRRSALAFIYLFNYIFSFFSVLILLSAIISYYISPNYGYYALLGLPILGFLPVLFKRQYIPLYIVSFAYSIFMSMFLVKGLIKGEHEFTRTQKYKTRASKWSLDRIVAASLGIATMILGILGLTIGRFVPATVFLIYAVSFTIVTAFW